MTTGDYSQVFYQLYDDLDTSTFIKLLKRLQYSPVQSLDNSKYAQDDVLSKYVLQKINWRSDLVTQ
jgi:hypothetical protein